MKKLLLTAALITVISTPVLANDIEGLEHDRVVSVDGMVCDFCAQSIKKVFSKNDAVKDILVDLDNGKIIIDLEEGQTLEDETITSLIIDSGYTVTEITHGDDVAKADVSGAIAE